MATTFVSKPQNGGVTGAGTSAADDQRHNSACGVDDKGQGIVFTWSRWAAESCGTKSEAECSGSLSWLVIQIGSILP